MRKCYTTAIASDTHIQMIRIALSIKWKNKQHYLKSTSLKISFERIWFRTLKIFCVCKSDANVVVNTVGKDPYYARRIDNMQTYLFSSHEWNKRLQTKHHFSNGFSKDHWNLLQRPEYDFLFFSLNETPFLPMFPNVLEVSIFSLFNLRLHFIEQFVISICEIGFDNI